MGNKKKKKNTTPNTPNKRSRANQVRGNAGKTHIAKSTVSAVAKQSPPLSKKRKVSTILSEQPKEKVNAKRTHIDHSNDPAYWVAVDAWFNTPAYERRGKIAHAKFYQVPCVKTFLRYIDDDPAKRRKLGKPPCRPSKVGDEATEELIQYVISYHCDNVGELSNAKIVNKLLEIMPKLSRPTARDYVRRTFKKKLYEYSRFRLIPLPKGTSDCIQQLVSNHVNEDKEDVFSCHAEAHDELSDNLKGKFDRLEGTKDSFTDGKRKLQNVQQSFIAEEEIIKIQATLLANLDVAGYDIKEPVLLTTEESSTEKIFRQQLHKDFEGDESMFVIVALSDKQNLYIEYNGTILSIELPKDHAFVGHASLIHAGSERSGRRLHFKLVSKDYVKEDTNTYFVKDSLYPRNDGILKF